MQYSCNALADLRGTVVPVIRVQLINYHFNERYLRVILIWKGMDAKLIKKMTKGRKFGEALRTQHGAHHSKVGYGSK